MKICGAKARWVEIKKDIKDCQTLSFWNIFLCWWAETDI
jgi:hypothetical protein